MTETETDDDADLLSRLKAARRVFTSIRGDLEALQTELEADGAEVVPGLQKRLDCIRGTLVTCIKSETDIDKLRKEQRGYVDGQRPLDLGRARDEICRALDRLRT